MTDNITVPPHSSGNGAEQDPQKKSGLKIVLKLVFSTIFVFLLLAAGAAGWLYVYYLTPCPLPVSQEAVADDGRVVVRIPRGSSLREIGDVLADGGLICKDLRFLILARLSKLSSRLPAGEFALKAGQRPLDLLRALAVAKPVLHSVTIPEGLTAAEIGKIFGDGGWCDPNIFNSLVHDSAFIDSLGREELKDIPSLEGYLFPDTYLFTRDMHGAARIIPLLVKHFFTVWGDLIAGLDAGPNARDDQNGQEKSGQDSDNHPTVEDKSRVPGGMLGLHESVILASMVEKEAALSEEQALIAGVFCNRLDRKMRLQSDPTVVYGIADHSGPITRADLKTETPYNTYTRDGLPAGPICNPGKGALRAALQPEETKALYFVARNDGSHQFSRSLAEHNRAVRKYQRKKSTKKGK